MRSHVAPYDTMVQTSWSYSAPLPQTESNSVGVHAKTHCWYRITEMYVRVCVMLCSQTSFVVGT